MLEYDIWTGELIDKKEKKSRFGLDEDYSYQSIAQTRRKADPLSLTETYSMSSRLRNRALRKADPQEIVGFLKEYHKKCK